MKATIIAVQAQKGGPGKTTTQAQLSYYLQKKGRTAIVDCDPQGNVTELVDSRDLRRTKDNADKHLAAALANPESNRPYWWHADQFSAMFP